MYVFAVVILFIMLFASLIGLFFGLSLIYSCLGGGVPWVRTGSNIAQAMFELADLQPGQTVLDIGCGDGSILFVAAKKFKAKGIGIDKNPSLIMLGKVRAKLLGVADKVKLQTGNAFTTKMPQTDLITCYLFPEFQEKLEPRLLEAYPSGTKVVTHAFKYPNLKLVKTAQINKTWVYLYQVP
jgi:SAM-dependent methyltransferase